MVKGAVATRGAAARAALSVGVGGKNCVSCDWVPVRVLTRRTRGAVELLDLRGQHHATYRGARSRC